MAEAYKETFVVNNTTYWYYPTHAIEGSERLPRSLNILVENVLRTCKNETHARLLAKRIVEAGLSGKTGEEIEFMPARVLFQDFTGVPVFVDFATMREACERTGGNPENINPRIPCDLVIDHSIIADSYGCPESQSINEANEQQRNAERYTFLKWAQTSFQNVRIVPPGVGICHQLNIENFSRVAFTDELKQHNSTKNQHNSTNQHISTNQHNNTTTVYFDTLVGTDSHTPTANGIGVLGWGVGGIEAEAAALGQPISILVPPVVGVHLTGRLQPGVTGMDVALTFAHTLRAHNVVGCFVECFGEGVCSLSATQRTCISNMTPEYGSTCTLFPVDNKTLDYLRLTGRSEEHIALVKEYALLQGMWVDESEYAAADDAAAATPVTPAPAASAAASAFATAAPTHRVYASVINLDLSSITPCVAGPSRPHDKIALPQVQQRVHNVCAEHGCSAREHVNVEINGRSYELTHGAIAIAAITSCTTATDPAMMLAAGMLAQAARKAGLTTKPWVKTIFAPGSHAISQVLEKAGYAQALAELGFYTCGFGCMSCIGNSGPVLECVHKNAETIEFASVLSGNRNFEGRISADVSQNYLMSPALVVAYALAGTMDINFQTQALGISVQGKEVFLRDLLPSEQAVHEQLKTYVNTEAFAASNRKLCASNAAWDALPQTQSSMFAWMSNSTYVRRAPYFDHMQQQPAGFAPITNAFVLAYLGDFITTDHISPAGSIAPNSPAATYLREQGVAESEFNTYGSRRGNHEVLMRGTFANVKLQNKLAPGTRGGYTTNWLTGEVTSIFDAASAYKQQGAFSVVLAGKMYGSGSSRDWAAKGPMLLGVRAVIAKSFERIHRSNLIGMGILPLQFEDEQDCETLGLVGNERISIDAVDFSSGVPVPARVGVHATRVNGEVLHFTAVVRVDTPTEGAYMHHGGILPYVIRTQ